MNSKELTDEEFVDRLVEAGWKRWEAERELQDIAEECESGYENHETNTTMSEQEALADMNTRARQELYERIDQLTKERNEAVANLVAERDQLAAKCASMVEGAELYESAIQWECTCFSQPESHCEQCEIVQSARKRFSDQCGAGWIGPEKKKVLVEALLRMIYGREDDPKDSNDLSAGEISVGDLRAAKQALEACNDL